MNGTKLLVNIKMRNYSCLFSFYEIVIPTIFAYYMSCVYFSLQNPQRLFYFFCFNEAFERRTIKREKAYISKKSNGKLFT